MAFEETEPPLEASAILVVEDPKDQEYNSSMKENAEVSKVVEAQTLHQEVEEVAKDDQGQHADVAGTGTEVGATNEAEGEITEVEAEAGAGDRAKVELQPPETEVGANNEAEGEITEVEAEAGAGDRAEVELQPPGNEAGEFGTGHHVKITEIGAELDSQGDGESEVPAESESEADDAGTPETDNDEEAEKPRKLTVDDIKTAPMDFRFPTTNQAKHCFTRYVEYHKCVQAEGDDNSDCNKYARYYRSLCPGEWVDKWNEQRENGTFPGPL